MNLKNVFKSVLVLVCGTLLLTSCPGPVPPSVTTGVSLANGVSLVGNCKKSDMSAMVFSWNGGPAEYKAASKLSINKLSPAGTHVIGIRAYIPSEGTDFSVFLGEGEDFDNPTVTKSAEWQEAGWQYVLFDEPVEIKTSDLFIGYTVNSLTFAVEETTNVDKMFINGEWTSLQTLLNGKASFALQAIVAGGDYSKKTQVDMAVDEMSVDAAWATQGDMVNGEALVRNNGVKTLRNVQVNATLGSQVVPVTITDSLMNGQSYLCKFSLTANGEGTQNVKVEVKADGDVTSKNNTATTALRVYADKGSPRNYILLEQFTTMKCPNCPRGGAAVQAAIDKMQHPDKVAWIAHHVGYYTDDFTLDESNHIMNALGVKGAPNGSLNRMMMDLDGSGQNLSVVLDYCADTEMLNALLDEPAQSTLNVERSYNADTREISVTVSGKSSKTDNYVSVMVTQNGIEGTQSGATGKYIHNHAVRLFMTPAAGQHVDVDADGNFTLTITKELPEIVNKTATVPSNMEIISFVHGSTSAAKTARFVYNADKQSLVSDATVEAPRNDYQEENGNPFTLFAPAFSSAN